MTLNELWQAAIDRRAVVAEKGQRAWVWEKPTPAAFVANLPGSTLVHLLPKLKLYEKPTDSPRSR